MPVKATVCGEPDPPSVILMLAALAPAATGLKVTDAAQLLPAASVAPHASVRSKSSSCAPDSAIDEMLKVAVPLFVMVRVFAAEVLPTASLPNARDFALNVTAPAPLAVVPVPVRLTVCVPAPSDTLTLADFAPTATGVKLTVNVQLAREASVAPHLLESAKSSDWLPDSAMDLKLRTLPPLLVTVTVFAADVEPLASLPKARFFALSSTAAADPAATVMTTGVEVEAP